MGPEERCADTDMLVGQCACAKHRNSVMDCEVYGDRTSAEKRRIITGRFKVRWGADCSDCGAPILMDEAAAYTNTGAIVCGPCSDIIEGVA
jgi:hypothetical protein